MTREYRYLGPDGEGVDVLPAGVGAALGSEYCVHLLPGAVGMARVAAAAASRAIPLILLTPCFRDTELKRAIPVFRAIPKSADVTVAVNDWGALLVLRVLFPWMRISIGRLLSGQKRCPRIGVSARLTPEGKAWHGMGLYVSARGRKFLAGEYGVHGFHLDRLPWTPLNFLADPCGEGGGGPALYVHQPFAIVTVSDACPWIGGKSSAAISSCPRPCREGGVLLREPSMGRDLIQKGKARFVRGEWNAEKRLPDGASGGVVLYEDLP